MTSIREASGLSSIGTVNVREAAGLSVIGTIKARDATNTLVTVFSSFSDSGLSVSPRIAEGFTFSHAFQRVSAGPVTVSITPAGAVDSVAWTFDDVGWEAISPTSLITSFRSPLLGPGDSQSVTATCTVTRGTTSASIDVLVSCSNNGS